MKKILLFTNLLLALICLCGCGKKNVDIVDISNLSAVKTVQEYELMSYNIKNLRFSDLDVANLNSQFVIIYNNETDIELTIILDNPKGKQIDAIEVSSSDGAAQILLENEWIDISDGAGRESVIANWSSENAYKKTYQIRVNSPEEVNNIVIDDIKVEGEWQGKGLKNDELTVYKVNDEAYNLYFVFNDSINGTVVHIEINKNYDYIQNLKVDNSTGDVDGDGNVFVISEASCEAGKFVISYDLVVDDVVIGTKYDTVTFEQGVLRGNYNFSWGDGYNSVLFENLNAMSLVEVDCYDSEVDTYGNWLGIVYTDVYHNVEGEGKAEYAFSIVEFEITIVGSASYIPSVYINGSEYECVEYIWDDITLVEGQCLKCGTIRIILWEQLTNFDDIKVLIDGNLYSMAVSQYKPINSNGEVVEGFTVNFVDENVTMEYLTGVKYNFGALHFYNRDYLNEKFGDSYRTLTFTADSTLYRFTISRAVV